MKLIPAATAVFAVVLFCASAHARSDAEQAGQQACGSDVFSLCGDAIPDRGRIEACLRRNYSRVSATCRHYMASYGRTHRPRSAERRHYTRHHYRIRNHYRIHHAVRHHPTYRRHTYHHRSYPHRYYRHHKRYYRGYR